MRYGLLFAVLLSGAAVAAAGPVDYEQEIKPLFLHKCAACHGSLKQSSGLRLDAGALILRGGEGGPVLQPGAAEASLLIERVADPDEVTRMPPAGEGEPLTSDQIELLKRWIETGAHFPEDETIPADPAEHWSYRAPVRPPLPVVEREHWIRTPIDAFIAAEQERRGLSPRAETSPEIWLRRVFLDLIGLPPTRDELRAFLADESPDAYEKVVDSLLERPEYGERWGRHWMDVWRYSDWYGSRRINEIRYSQRHIWRWRDWIVDSLNADKPYDRMLVEMLAGDEFAPADPDVLRATGFLGRNWYKFDRNVWLFETVEQTSQAFLGVTLRCARCHDHKYDPISQEEYYRFRAFFEPHDVRTDPLAADTPREKDATLGMVLSDGLSRVYDKDGETPTYLFVRGDDRAPDETRPLSPGVPAILSFGELLIEPVPLPPEAYYPHLRPELAEGLEAVAERGLREAEDALSQTKQVVAAAEQAVSDRQARIDRGELVDGIRPVILQDDFTTRGEVWKPVSGTWSWEAGKVVERSVGSFATLVADVTLPRDFQARVRYRTLQPGHFRSVGFSFDYVDRGNSQDVYTSVNDAAPSVQAFHRVDGKQEYPQAGIVKTPLSVDEEITVEVQVRGQELKIQLNGEQKLEYVMPVPRREGKFALWVHSGSAEFIEVEVREAVPTLDDLRGRQREATAQVNLAEQKVEIARLELVAVRARVAAERTKYLGGSREEMAESARNAGRAERRVAVAQAQLALMQAGQFHETVLAAEPADAETKSTGLQDAEKKLAAAEEALQAAQAALENADGTYTPLGDVAPSVSTGRRLALARWITAAENPRTARVAVNHIWLRHFGQALVPTVSNFGLSGQPPSHPELLDWLAAELVENGWRMKPLHRRIVLSATYRQSSSTGEEETFSGAADPDNRYLWRMNSRRMEAEVVRDTLLFTAGVLNLTRGGPEIPETEGQTVFRRSLYFRNTPNESMPFLETFDAPNPNECYRRQESVVPQQALALMNSSLAQDQARILAEQLSQPFGEDDGPGTRRKFIIAAFETILSRVPTERELTRCEEFLTRNRALVESAGQQPFPAGNQKFQRAPSDHPAQRARENLIHVLYSHNDFVTVR